MGAKAAVCPLGHIPKNNRRVVESELSRAPIPAVALTPTKRAMAVHRRDVGKSRNFKPIWVGGTDAARGREGRLPDFQLDPTSRPRAASVPPTQIGLKLRL